VSKEIHPMDTEAALKHLKPLFDRGSNWLQMEKPVVLGHIMEAIHALEGVEESPEIEWDKLSMLPSPGKALAVLRGMISGDSLDYHEMITVSSFAHGYLHGLVLPSEVQAKYKCHVCGKTGVKLWRMAASSCVEGYCSKCGMAQAGYPDTIGEDGRNDEGDYGTSDQIYNGDQGANLVPWVIDVDGSTWGYTSVPTEGVSWWKALPTR
jgi:hypothetical protein